MDSKRGTRDTLFVLNNRPLDLLTPTSRSAGLWILPLAVLSAQFLGWQWLNLRRTSGVQIAPSQSAHPSLRRRTRHTLSPIEDVHPAERL